MFKKGDRIKMVRMVEDPDPIEPGTLGTITDVIDLWLLEQKRQVHLYVNWDNGRTLSPVVPPDVVEKVKE